jgi:hypothetical protein
MSTDLTLSDFFLWGYTKPLTYSLPVGTEEDLTASIVEGPATIRREPSIFERTRQSLLRLCFVLRSVGVRLDICCSTLVRNAFFLILKWFYFISKRSQTHFDGRWHYQVARPTCSCLTINLCFGLSYHLKKFGHGSFPRSVYSGQNVTMHSNVPLYTK